MPTTLLIREEDAVWRTTMTGRVTIGRAPTSDLILRGEQVSWDHAIIEVKDERIFITDQSSPGGTYVNGKRIEAGEPTPIVASDTVKIGLHYLRLELSDGAMPTTARMPAAPPSAPPPAGSPSVHPASVPPRSVRVPLPSSSYGDVPGPTTERMLAVAPRAAPSSSVGERTSHKKDEDPAPPSSNP